MSRLRKKLPNNRADGNSAVDQNPQSALAASGSDENPRTFEVYWDGTIRCSYPDPNRSGYVVRKDMGSIALSIQEKIEPFFEKQRERYGTENLLDGALVFDVSEEGNLSITVDAPNRMVVGKSPRPNGIVYRKEGGCSFHNENLAELGIFSQFQLQQLGGSALEFTHTAQHEIG